MNPNIAHVENNREIGCSFCYKVLKFVYRRSHTEMIKKTIGDTRHGP